ncbi:MAG TPA: transglycosylase domain-containing protein [Vicinamibacterales bacterium]|nr:transglycosylase domain-containing protein [Vicinamibacterales bacterium]
MRHLRRGVTAGLAVCCAAAVLAQVATAALYATSIRRLQAVNIHDGGRRLLATPLSLRAGEPIGRAEVLEHLRRIGYYDSAVPSAASYSVTEDSITIHPRFAEFRAATIRWSGASVASVHDLSGQALDVMTIEPETLQAWDVGMDGVEHEILQLPAPVAALRGGTLLDALIASEEGRFHEQHGVDLLRLVRAVVNGTGASTLAMQVARQTVLHERSRTVPRKLAEIGLAMAIDRKYDKNEILDAYVTRIYLGTLGGRELRGFAVAAEELLGVSDLRRLTLAQAATLVASLNRPDGYIAEVRAGNVAPLKAQRDRVLRLAGARFPERYSASVIQNAQAQPLSFLADHVPHGRRLDAAYFTDHAAPLVSSGDEGRTYLTVDGRFQRAADLAVIAGVARLEERLGKSPASLVQVALIVVDPRTGEVRAMVGGRSYQVSQFNRATMGGRQVGSLVKPYDYLAAFERGSEEGVALSPDSIVADVPTVFRFANMPWSPRNYGGQYGGSITWRHALAHSKNVAAVKVSAWAGFQRVATLWARATGRPVDVVYPSFALGATEATPAQVAQAYTVFANGGIARPLRFVGDAVRPNGVAHMPAPLAIRVAGAGSARNVAEMMRAVFEVGTARASRQMGFIASAAGKTGTTDDQRDAWFAGFSGDLLAVVWVGRDDNAPLGLTGAEAALPIWTDFMMVASRSVPVGR